MDLINFFFNVAKTHFFHVFGVFGKLFRHIANGGANIFRRVLKGGGRKILDGQSFQIP